MFSFFKNDKIKLTSHEQAIDICHLNEKIMIEQKHIDDNPDKDTWCTKHDIQILKKIILYLEQK